MESDETSEKDIPASFSEEDINSVELPPCIDIKESLVHKGEPGAFAKVFIRKDTRFGPYKGEIINPGQKDFIDYRYAWEVHEKRSRVLKYTISALDPKASNWMRHVNNARFYEEQNILSIQDGFSIFYVAMKNIEEGQELLTWFDPKLLKRTQRRQAKTERRPIGYTIELVPWSEEKKFTPEIIDTKRSRKKKVRSDMIALDEDPKAMTRTLQSLPKIPCTPRQLGNMAYPLANTLKRPKKERPARPAARQRNCDEKRQADRKTLQDKPDIIAYGDKNVASLKTIPHIERKQKDVETKLESDLIKLEALPPHENLKEALQAAENSPTLVLQLPLPQDKAPAVCKHYSNQLEPQDNKKKKRGRKRLSDMPRGRPRMFNAGIMNPEYRPGVVRPLGLKTNSDGSVGVEDHDESYTLTGVTLRLMCDDQCPCLDKAKCMRARDPPAAANQYAIGFTLLPEHKVVQNSRVVYKCDVCDGIYNHAFSLKRHYLSVHVNHRYLTREDIVSCQIETFHKGIQIEEGQPAPMTSTALQNASPVPTFMAVNVTNLLTSLSPPKKSLKVSDMKSVEELGNRLHCDEDLSVEKEIVKGNLAKQTAEKHSIPTLASLAQNCLHQVALQCKETVNSRVMDPLKLEFREKKDDISSPSENSTEPEVPESTDLINRNFDLISQADSSNLSSTKDEKEANVDTLNSLENKNSCDNDVNSEPAVLSSTPSDGDKCAAPTDDDKSATHGDGDKSATPTDGDKSATHGDGDKSATPTDGDKSATHGDGDKSATPTDGDKSATHGDGDKSATPTDGDKSATPSDGDKCAIPTDGDMCATPCGGDKSATPNDGDKSATPSDGDKSATPTDGNKSATPSDGDKSAAPTDGDKSAALTDGDKSAAPSDGDKSATPSDGDKSATPTDGDKYLNLNLTSTNKESESKTEKEERESTTSVKSRLPDTETPEEDDTIANVISVNDSECLVNVASEPNLEKDMDCHDETDSSVMVSSDSRTTSTETAAASASEDLTPLSCDNAKLASPKSADIVHPYTEESSKDSNTAQAPNPSNTSKSDSTQDKVSLISQSSSCGLSPSSTKPASPACTQLQNTSSSQAARTSAQPPVIFLTNIVFPVPGTLGQPIISPQRPLAPSTSQVGVANSSAPTALPSQPPISLVQTVGSNVRLPGPRAPIPLVLISQVPPGVDPRNAANTFLKTSTGIKTLQDLQKSFTVAAMGNASTQLTASNMPCIIGPLCQGANTRPGSTTTSITSIPTTMPATVSGLTTLPPKVSLSVSTSVTAVSMVNGSIVTVSSAKTLASPTSCISTLSAGTGSPNSITALSTPSSTISSTQSNIPPAHSSDQPEDLFRCHMCVLVFQTMQQLKQHIRNDPHRFKGGIKQYACQQCSMRFSNKSNLARHNLMNHSETEEFMFRCSTCGKGFSSETYLKMHARFHLGKSFPCKYGCVDLYFPNAATLVKHLRAEHAGLDLKEYKRIHKIRPVRRKKISQILGPGSTSTSLSMSAPYMTHTTLGQHGFKVPPGGAGTAIHGHVIGPAGSILSKESSPYSLLQPGVGFQAKRGRPKGSKNTVKNGKPIIPSPSNSPSMPPPQTPPPPPPLPLTVEIPPAPEPIRRKRGIARFRCKICPKKFTTHLKLVRHRRRKHGMDQSVQEYLHIMSKNVDSYTSERDETVYSPPASPKTFFSTVCQRGYENFTQFIDGGPESLKSPIKKYIDIKGFFSISAPFDHTQEQQLELEWTAYNFPPTFKYKYDSTTFYDTEKGENFTTLTDNRLASVKSENHQSEKERDSSPEMDDIEKETEKLLNEDPLAKPIKSEEPEVKETDCDTILTTLHVEDKQTEGDKKPNHENLSSQDCISDTKCEADSEDSRQIVEEDSTSIIGSKERGKQVIESLARHLACEKLPEGESDQCEFLSQEEDEGVEWDGDELAEDLNIKAEPLDENTTAEALKDITDDKGINGAHDRSGCQADDALNTQLDNKKLCKPQNPCIQNDQSGKSKPENIKTQSIVQDDTIPSGTDSGLSSLSSCTLDESPNTVQSHMHGTTSKQGDTVPAASSSFNTNQNSSSSTEHHGVSEEMKGMKSLAKDKLPLESKLPVLNPLDKNKLMRSLTIQSLLTNDSLTVVDCKPSVSALALCGSLNALDLCVSGGQLNLDKLAKMMQSTSSRQETGFRPDVKVVRHRSISLPSFKEEEANLNSSDAGKHHEHKRLSLWAGHLPQKALDSCGEEVYHYCPIVNTIQKQQILRELESYRKAKADRDQGMDRNQFPGDKLSFAESMGLMSQTDFNMYPKQKEYDVIKPPEVWANYENIWFGKRGTIVVVCSICHRHFSCWDLCLRHQLKKHPHIEPNFLQMEKGNYVDDMYYYYPMKYGILAKTEPIPSNLPLPELYVCTRCGFPFRNLNRLHAHIVSCDPSLEGGAGYKSFQNKKKLIPMMDRRLSQQNVPADPAKPKLGRPFKRPPAAPATYVSGSGSSERLPASQLTLSDSSKFSDRAQSPGSAHGRAASVSHPFSFYHGRKRKNYELLYNPQNHMRRREMYQVLDTHQCHGCNLKFKSMSMLERHVKKCSGRDRLQNQKPLLSGIMPDDAAVRKQHTCRYCNKRFTYIKGVDLHYKRICSVRKVKEEEGKLTPEDLAHEEELRRIIEHMKWSKTLNKDSSDIIQGNVRVEEDGSLTRVVKKRGCPVGAPKRVKKRKVKNKKWTYMKNHRHANRSAASLAGTIQQFVLRSPTENFNSHTHIEDNVLASSSGEGQISFQEKKSPANEHSPPPPKKRTLPESSSSVSNTSTESTSKSGLSPTGKRGRPRKYPVGDPRSRTPRLTRSNSAASKVTEAQKTSAQASAVKSSSSEAEIETSSRPEPRKRGRPKKFDPSDMESSYKKKKKAATVLVEDSVTNNSDWKHSEDNSAMLPSEQSAGRAITRRQQRAKMPTAVVRDDYVYEDPTPSLKRKLVPGKTKGGSLSAQSTKDTSGLDEKSPFSEIELMEKMKQLKKAAQLESDKYKQRQEQRRAKAKNMQNLECSKSSKISDKTPNVPVANSTELFKHLTTENTLLSSKTKSRPSQREHSQQVTTLPVKTFESIGGGKPPCRKSSHHKTSKSSTSITKLEKKKLMNSPKLLSASVQIKTPGPTKDQNSRPTAVFSPKSKAEDSEKADQNNSGNTPNLGTLRADNKELPTKVSSIKALEKTMKSPVLQLPECSVKVVTLSPKATSLVGCKHVSENTSTETNKCSNQTLQQKINKEKPEAARALGLSTSDVDKHIQQKQEEALPPLPQKSLLEKDEEQAALSSEISIDLSLYSTGEELLSTADETSTLSQASFNNFDKSTALTQHVNTVQPTAEVTTGKATETERNSNSNSVAGEQPHHKAKEETKTQATSEEPAPKRPKRTKIVFVQAGKTPQVLSEIKCKGLEDLINPSNTRIQPSPASCHIQSVSSQTFRLPTSISTLCKSKVENSNGNASLAVSGDVDSAHQSIQTGVAASDIPFAVLEGSTVIAKKSVAAPIKIIRGGLPPNKTPSVAPITVFSSQRTMPVPTSVATNSSSISGPANAATPLSVANLSSPMTVLPMEGVKADFIKGQSLKQCEPLGTTNLTTHFQIKGGVVMHKPRIIQTTASAVKPIHIVSSLNRAPSDVPACKGMISPNLITTAVAQSSSVHLGSAGHVQPVASQTMVKTSAKIISPPARVISQNVSPIGAMRPRLITPHKTLIQIPSAGMRPVVASVKGTSQEKLQTGKLAVAAASATAASTFPRMPVATGSLQRPPIQTHVIRTLVPSKSSLFSSAQHPPPVTVSALTPGQTANRSMPALATTNIRTAYATKPSSSASQYHYVQSTPVLPTRIISPQQISLQPETTSTTNTAEPDDVFSISANDDVLAMELEGEPLVINPPSNPIMITLEDGSTTMLDPESLAQLLSPVEENVSNVPVPGMSEPGLTMMVRDPRMSEPSLTMMVPDPGSVMVNMAEIQPGQGVLQTGEVLWEGFPDMSDDLFTS